MVTLAAETFPAFVPHPLLRGGDAQTIGAIMFPGRKYPYRARQHRVELEDGDQIVLHDDSPPGWRQGQRTVLLIHGLSGCHLSGYMQRISAKLHDRGLRTFRMDLRGCGAGALLARRPYHSGQSEDARAALEWIARTCPESPTTLTGFSLAGNLTLKLLGEAPACPPGNLDSAIAVCPPIDLTASIQRIMQPRNRAYDRYFVRQLMQQIRARWRRMPDAATVDFARDPRRLWDLDDVYTAPLSGFGCAENYYRICSSAPLIPRILLPTLILASRDDPLIPVAPFETLALPPAVRLCLTESGGHLGYVSRLGTDPDRRWLDWRIVDWITRLPPR